MNVHVTVPTSGLGVVSLFMLMVQFGVILPSFQRVPRYEKWVLCTPHPPSNLSLGQAPKIPGPGVPAFQGHANKLVWYPPPPPSGWLLEGEAGVA
jgi:hypothetical protein